MIITRSPLRITLGGGGTDLPSYYREHSGFVISAAIDKYVYVSVIRPFVPGIFLIKADGTISVSDFGFTKAGLNQIAGFEFFAPNDGLPASRPG